jgi:hypothetical protein
LTGGCACVERLPPQSESLIILLRARLEIARDLLQFATSPTQHRDTGSLQTDTPAQPCSRLQAPRIKPHALWEHERGLPLDSCREARQAGQLISHPIRSHHISPVRKRSTPCTYTSCSSTPLPYLYPQPILGPRSVASPAQPCLLPS